MGKLLVSSALGAGGQFCWNSLKIWRMVGRKKLLQQHHVAINTPHWHWLCDRQISNWCIVNHSWPFYSISIFMSALRTRCGHYVFALWFLSIFFFLVWSQRPHIGCLPYFGTWCGFSANLERRSEMCCKRLTGNTGRKTDAKIAIWSPAHKFVGLRLFN